MKTTIILVVLALVVLMLAVCTSIRLPLTAHPSQIEIPAHVAPRLDRRDLLARVRAAGAAAARGVVLGGGRISRPSDLRRTAPMTGSMACDGSACTKKR